SIRPRPASLPSSTMAEVGAWLRSLPRLVSVLVLAAVATFLFAVVVLVAGYPRSFEAAAYHLPIALHIFQAHSLKPWDSAFNHTIPAGASLYYGFLLTFLPERLVSVSNLLLLVPTFASIYALARLTGADRGASSLTSVGYVTIPIVALCA